MGFFTRLLVLTDFFSIFQNEVFGYLLFVFKGSYEYLVTYRAGFLIFCIWAILMLFLSKNHQWDKFGQRLAKKQNNNFQNLAPDILQLEPKS